MKFILLAVLASIVLAASDAAAFDDKSLPSEPIAVTDDGAAASASVGGHLARVDDVPDPPTWHRGRPRILPFLYVTCEALQIYDAYSTFRGAGHRAVETNPVVGAVMGNSALFVGLKTASTLTSILAAERMWKNHHRKTAIVTMLVVNAVLAGVAANNANVLSRSQH